MQASTGALRETGLRGVSRTYQYRKVMKPLLERKRRARINKCLEEIKQLIMEAAHIDAEALSKLEKADILELTVHHLHQQRATAEAAATAQQQCGKQASPMRRDRLDMEKYWIGFQHCALEVARFLQRHDKLLSLKFFELMGHCMPQKEALCASSSDNVVNCSSAGQAPSASAVWRPW